MSKTLILSFAWLFTSILQMNAQSLSIYRDNALRYVGIEEIKNYNLYNKKDNPSCNLKINFFYPVVSNNKELQNRLQTYFITSFFDAAYSFMSPSDAVKSYSKDYLENYKNTFEKSGLYKKDEEKSGAEGKDTKEYQHLYSYEKTMRNTIKFNRGDIISQVINVYEYTGGAHGASSTKGLVYDITKGEDITYDEIFHEGTENEISSLLRTYLMQERRYENDTAMIDAGFNSLVIPPSHNFIADDKGITFIYNPYELGAYVLGIVEIFVPYSELFIYMKPESTLFRWAETHFAGNRVKYETSYLSKEYYAYNPDRFPGFIAQIHFTYPGAYYDKTVLEKLQRIFIINAFGEEYASYEANEVVETFYGKMLADYEAYVTSDETKEFIAKELAETNEEDDSSQAYFMSLGKEFTLTNTFHLNQNDLISYEVSIYTYDGGAHGMDADLGFVVRLSTAQNLSYEDIFTSDSKSGITSLLIRNLLESKGYQSTDQLKKDNYETDLIVPNNNFYMDNEGITFIYTPYEIGPYSLGITKIKILYSELTDYLRINIQP
ncbi:MAG: DUF3298 domain-containing protein [Bacteroidales bacterium]|nr:DUF3298 domain-containing protein [Bacteroidales bacterium]